MAKATITIKSVTPLMMKRYPPEPIPGFDKMSKEEQAEHSSYRIPGSKELFIPGEAMQRALINGAAYSKGKGRASLQKVAAACFAVLPERIGLGVDKFEVDSRPVVMPATRGRIMRHRPRLDKWEAKFGIEWDEEELTTAQIKKVLQDTGKKVGLLEYRPACKGRYGKFEVTKFEEEK